VSKEIKFLIWTFALIVVGYVIPNETIIGKAISFVCFVVAGMRMARWMEKK
jgi:CBS domain containing-hemolysin-like protein